RPVYGHEAARSHAESPAAHIAAPALATLQAEIESFLLDWIARRSGQPITAVVPNAEFAALGMGSLDSIDLSAALSEKYALRLDSTVLWNHPNIKELAAFVLARVTTGDDRADENNGVKA